MFLHAGIKFPWFVFFQKDSGMRPPDPPLNMKLAMYVFAGLCILLGVWTDPLYAILPYPVDYVPYTGDHLVSQFQLLLFAGLAFFVMLPMMKRTETISLDLDWFYRRFFKAIGTEFTVRAGDHRQELEQAALARLGRFVEGLYRHHGPQGILARTWPTGSTVLWVAILLGVYVVIYYI